MQDRKQYLEDFQKLRKKVDRYQTLTARARCLEGHDCNNCIYLEARLITDFKTCALGHRRHVSEEDLRKLRDYYNQEME